ncbi:hypothetical protein PTSG_00936 [Salpingoeca rosetta]|uniref:Fork-head domain-containing protein n=1 Tax=Salpingoeca rosetta (strain ATCC 50818 / BSB-021) TaxID=946362 RepID=F2TXX5_SALR5|nr:uncharacterized protein PTSG_00936 [Salpingoeca rosetta]EGD76234.1 hypothetical protein PTSG_00936 [Salpingoeca rosetta]|eukprot:XP_004998409.1 hypothetical protein PTSG_00936 [Salpingoeca rosetta]
MSDNHAQHHQQQQQPPAPQQPAAGVAVSAVTSAVPSSASSTRASRDVPHPGKSAGSDGNGNTNNGSSTTTKGKGRQDIALNESLTSIDWLPRLNVGRGREDGKPPYSYATLITFALNSVKTGEKKMTLADIYEWIQENYPYFRTADKGWKNSVRHNLSLNKMFKKVPRDPADHGKGCYWAINEDYDPETDGSKTSRKRKKKTSKSSDTGEEPAKKPPTAFSPTSSMSGVLQQAQLAELLGSQGIPSASFSSLVPQQQAQQQQQQQQTQQPLSHQQLHDNQLAVPDNIDLNASLSAFHDLNSSFSQIYSSIVDTAPATTPTTSSTAASIITTTTMAPTAPAPAAPATSTAPTSSVTATAAAPPVLTFETVQGVMSNLESNPPLLQTLDQSLYKKTQDLVKNVQGDMSLSGNWLLSPHFPDLAASFNTLLQSSTNPLASMDLSALPMAPKQPQPQTTDIFNVDEEEEFDWDTLPMA